MQGDRIVIEAHHRRAADAVDAWLNENGLPGNHRLVIAIAGESGSGKSEVAAALAEALRRRDVNATVFQQDDYFVHPPRSNDRERRANIDWVGPGEVRLGLLDEHLSAFKDGARRLNKPLVIYEDDRIDEETVDLSECSVAIAEGTYMTLLDSADVRVFIDRDWRATRAHREKRNRDTAELDAFIDRVLEIEHGIISQHKAGADLVIAPDFSLRTAESD